MNKKSLSKKSLSQAEKWTGCPLFLKVSSILVVLYHIPVLKATEKEWWKGL